MAAARIQQLPPEVAGKIAAGEVIDRPASVVKELLDNAVDAGAARIDVEIEEGGIESIRVIDNGGGIVAEDLPLAFARNATSKLRDSDDLFRVRSLGFRGEALASIGSVAQVRLRSRPPDADAGAEIECRGGELGHVRPCSAPPGTSIQVRHLFFNTPVRRKFLRSAATEAGHVSECVVRMALAFPQLHLKLSHNQREVFEVTPAFPLADRLRLFYGPEVADALLPVVAAAGPMRLTGFIGDPACHRGNARMQYLFVNGRCIRDRSLAHAVQEAYRGLLMVGRQPVCFLFLELPPHLVDVNVHPTKSEVRFRDAQAVYQLVRATLRDTLTRANLTAAMHSPSSPFLLQAPRSDRPGTLLPEPLPWASGAPAAVSPPEPATAYVGAAAHSAVGVPPAQLLPTEATPPALRKAFQLHDAYLVMETPEGMLVVDQHALHERVLYEAWKARLGEGKLESQPLLTPEPVDLPPDQSAAVLEHREALAALGLGVEEFGRGTLLVQRYPPLWRGTPGDLLKLAAEHLAGTDRPPCPAELLDDLLKLMACKAAVKAGDRLSDAEIAALLEYRDLTRDAHHCPHGRPTALYFSKQELDRQFKRI